MFNELYTTVKNRYGTGNATHGMADWIAANTTLNNRQFTFEHYQFQKAIADDMHPDMSVKKCSQVGLALDLATPIATPTGWTTMGALKVGDTVFDDVGKPTRVNFVSEVFIDHPCYDVEFDDGSVLRADENHRWLVKTHRGPFNTTGVFQGHGRPRKEDGYCNEGVVSTKFLAENRHLTTFFVSNASPLDLPSRELPLDPWVLGLWLGDGHSYSARLTTHEDDRSEIESELIRRGYGLRHIGKLENEIRIGDKSIYHRLSALGVIKNKHIPLQYLRASREQRLDVLRGLLDTDGTITKRGRISFYNNNPELVAEVEGLVASLGLKTRTRWRFNAPSVMKNGQVITPRKPVGEVSFVAACTTPLFNLPRKAERQVGAGHRPRFTQHRTIVDVRKTLSVPTRCIQVDAPSHLFLAGTAMIPTHNTEVQIRKFLAVLTRHNGISGIFSLPNEKMFTRLYNGRLKPIIEADSVFNPTTGIKPTRSKDMTQIRNSFGYLTACTEGDATSISADFLMHDEVDLSPQDILSLYQSRVQNSDMKITQKFSTPTFSGFGIDTAYGRTDQREYLCRCSACNHWQIPSFEPRFIHIDDFKIDVSKFDELTSQQIEVLQLDTAYVRCERCSRRLDLGNPDMREWVATYPLRTLFRGYQVRPFSTSRLSPSYIFRQLAKHLDEQTMRHFRNTVLGEADSDANSQIQRESVEACMTTPGIQDVPDGTPCFIGIDVGFTCHITISFDDHAGIPHFVLFEAVPIAQLEQRVSELKKIYNIIQGVIDRFPYTTVADTLRETTGSLIMPAQYRGTAAIVAQKDELGMITHYSVNNANLFDRLQSAINGQKMVISGYLNQREILISHLTDMKRDELPEKGEVIWRKNSGNDHYFHSMAFNLLGRRICEHLFHSGSNGLNFSSAFSGADWLQSGTALMPGKGAARISRLGAM